MRIGIGEFVGARFTVPQNPILGVSGGMGEFVNAGFTVPQNPIMAARGGMGEFAPACFSIPQNPIGLSGIGMSGLSGDCGCGCNGSGACKSGMEGLIEDVQASVSETYDSVKASVEEALGGNAGTYLMVGGAIVVGFMLFSRGGGYREASKNLRAEYRRKQASLKSSYGRGYQRLGRAGKAAYAAL